MKIKDVFESKILKMDGNGNCWIWEGNVGNHGYGRINLLGTNISTHRFSYELYMGDISSDKSVLHKCNNRLCVNPDHLYLGDAQDNARDWMEARRLDTQKVVKYQTKPLSILERDLIVNTLNGNQSSRRKTANELGISTTTLWRKMKEYGIR